MRKSIVATASVAILSVAALGACDMNFGKKSGAPANDEAAQTASGAGAGGAATESSSGKPDDDSAGGGSAGGAGEGPKPGDDAAGGAAGGPAGGSSGPQVVGQIHEGFDEQISSYLDHYQQQFGQGFGSSGVQDVVTGLRGGAEYRWNVGTLRGGQTYTFLGACDQDCTDVDLIIEDENGNRVGEDLLTDDYPVVTITPRRDGPFTARILLVNCAIEPCYVGGRVLQQGR